MSVIKNTGEATEFFPVALTVDLNLILPRVPDVINKFILPYLGSAQLALLETWYDDSKPEETYTPEGGEEEVVKYLENLLPYVQRAVVRFAIFMSVDELDLMLTNSGFVVTSNASVTPASPDRVAKFKRSMEQSGWDAIELMLRFLETNKANYTAWTGSDAYTMAKKNFVNSAVEFDAKVGINQSRLDFHRYRLTMDRIEYEKIIPVISQDLYDAIKAEILEDDVSEDNAVILPLLKNALIFFTAAEEIDKKYEGIAKHYLTDVKKILNANPDNYPAYRDSGLYEVDVVNYPPYENTEDSTGFVFGSSS
jgi:hypothetical protein